MNGHDLKRKFRKRGERRVRLPDIIMNLKITTNEYNTFDSKKNSNHNRKRIDGIITGRGKCVGYCKYINHPGFLTDDLRTKQKCLDKKCIYYIPKPKKNLRINAVKNNEQENILALSMSLTKDMEGMKIMRVNREKDGGWTIFYISISNYCFNATSRIIEEKTGNKVKFVDLRYNFEIAADLIFGNKYF